MWGSFETGSYRPPAGKNPKPVRFRSCTEKTNTVISAIRYDGSEIPLKTIAVMTLSIRVPCRKAEKTPRTMPRRHADRERRRP